MRGTGFQFAYLSDPRLAAHALSPTPTWLWSADATRILWANPTAAAMFDADSPGALAAIPFDSKHPAAAEIARLSGTLPQGGGPRLERLRGFDIRSGGLMICLCSRFLQRDATSAILVRASFAAVELPLSERARRLLADADRPAAIFTAMGELINYTPAARDRLGAARNLIALGAEKLVKEANLYGQAEGEIDTGHVVLHRLGAGTTVALLVAFEDPTFQPTELAGAPATERVEEISSPLPVAPLVAAPAGPSTVVEETSSRPQPAPPTPIEPPAPISDALASASTPSLMETAPSPGEPHVMQPA